MDTVAAIRSFTEKFTTKTRRHQDNFVPWCLYGFLLPPDDSHRTALGAARRTCPARASEAACGNCRMLSIHSVFASWCLRGYQILDHAKNPTASVPGPAWVVIDAPTL